MPISDQSIRPWVGQLAGLLLVLALHGGIFYGLLSARLITPPSAAATLFVNFIAPPPANPTDRPKPPPESKPKPKLQPPKPAPLLPQQVATTSVITPAEPVLAVPPPQPVAVQTGIDAPPAASVTAPLPEPVSLPVGPVVMRSELSVACPQRSAPSYPALSVRLNEAGAVLLRVELSETGTVSTASVQSSSGFARLDNAALAAVHSWHCTPATRNGQPVRASALQPFNFVIQGN